MPETNLDILNSIIEGKEKLNIDALNILAQACAEKAGTTSAGPFKYNIDALKEIAENIKNIDGGGGGDDPTPEPEPGVDEIAELFGALLAYQSHPKVALDDPAFTAIKRDWFRNGTIVFNEIYAPYVVDINGDNIFAGNYASYWDRLLFPALQNISGAPFGGIFPINNFNPKVVDIGKAGSLTSKCFNGCRFNNLVIRRESPPAIQTDTFDNTKISSGGAGAKIYIPKALFDHLGDGSALDYKAATNWSVYDSYGTITWAQIEGSEFESYD